ncbi:hypothetical protein KP509_09G000700 [Ceratopteris richardii]|uniref:FAF domain-containing protein n=1 Tax=Ceratopteris richardii TaxID=49495 RepID=A0A8T2U1A1_CERRI|nr:hypothetical protein KP509_09G000700 [Ceratopteris richardii]
MTIYPLSGASWPVKQQAPVSLEGASGQGSSQARKNMPGSQRVHFPTSYSRGAPRLWELRRIASTPVIIDADYWSDSSMSAQVSNFDSPILPISEGAVIDNENDTKLFSDATTVIQRRGGSGKVDEQDEHREVENLTGRSFSTKRRSFPPPLDSPALREGRYSHLESVEKVPFACTRSSGRLLITESSASTQQSQRRLRAQRQNGSLVLWLEEAGGTTTKGKPKEEQVQEEGRVEKEISTIYTYEKEEDIDEDGAMEEVEEESGVKQGAEELDCVDRENSRRSKKTTSKRSNLYTRVLKTLEGDVGFGDGIAEVVNPLRRPCKYGVGSLLHKSLTHVRPLNVLTIWQS